MIHMDIVKFTFRPQNKSELIAVIDEINRYADLTAVEKQQLIDELSSWNKTQSEP
jgi:hypothetical protein